MKRLRGMHPGWVAGTIAVAVCLWLLTGLFSGKPEAKSEDMSAPAEHKITKVQILHSVARNIVREERVNGHSAPLRSVKLRAEVDGRIEQLSARGQYLKKGDTIARIAMKDREVKARQAKALLDQRTLQYNAAKQLAEEGQFSRVDLATAHTNLLSAEVEYKQASENLANTRIRAPFAGVLETHDVELGQYVNPGDTIGSLIQNNPSLIKAQVTEDVIGYLKSGQAARVILPDGSEREGVLRYVASQADEATRTFPVELEIPNPGGELVAGTSAVLALALESRRVHEVEPAVLALDEAGEFGLKTVDDNDIVQFHKAVIVQNHGGKVWLADLPDELRIIRVGHGFVATGQKVEAVTRPVEE